MIDYEVKQIASPTLHTPLVAEFLTHASSQQLSSVALLVALPKAPRALSQPHPKLLPCCDWPRDTANQKATNAMLLFSSWPVTLEAAANSSPSAGAQNRKSHPDTSQSSRPVQRDSSSSGSESESDASSDSSASVNNVGSQLFATHLQSEDASEDADIHALADRQGPSRKEREAAQKQAAKERYDKLQAEGKTDEAKSDLARLAVIRQQREAAAAKRKAESESKNVAPPPEKPKPKKGAKRPSLKAALLDS